MARALRCLLAVLVLAGCGQAPPPATCQGAGGCPLADGGSGVCCGIGTACVDSQSDSANCGACGIVCPPGQSCNSGSCG
ncbi:MAG: hypothetical protein ACYDCL_04575 [Myxococcales bacterium]